jgi:thiol-disulfide isomerase/thioredoxin
MVSNNTVFAVIAVVVILVIAAAVGLLVLAPNSTKPVSTSTSSSSTISLSTQSSSSQSSSSSSSSSITNSSSSTTTSACTGTCAALQLLGENISTALKQNLTDVSFSTLSSIGSGHGVSGLTSINGSKLMNNGKPEVLYIGAQYCPFCMAEDWSMIVALSKFGNFSGIEYMMSETNYNYSNTAGFTFVSSHYTSQYVSLVTVEYENRVQGPLQTVSNSEYSTEQKYDPGLEIPFIDFANEYTTFTSQYSPVVISNLNWTEIASQLNSTNSSVANSIDGAANSLISAVCKIDGGQPASVCGQSFASASPTTFNNILVNGGSIPFLLLASDSQARYSEFRIH